VTPVVVQSFHADPPAWIERCLASVRHWAEASGFGYRFLGDELFARVPDWVREKTRHRPMVASDLARLRVLEEIVGEGRAAIWLDADVVVHDPARLTAALDLSEGFLFGRETWVQPDRRGRPSVRRSVHNALCAFAPGNAFLPFYIEAATRILARHTGHDLVPQIIGPKFLTAQHNMMGLPATAAVNMASPMVIADLAAGGGPAWRLFRDKASPPPAALNLCQSYTGRTVDGVAVTPHVLETALDRLVSGALAAP
jgi:hypothetical protein